MKHQIYEYVCEIIETHGYQLNVDDIEIVVVDEFHFELHFANGSSIYTTMYESGCLYPAVEDSILYGRWNE